MPLAWAKPMAAGVPPSGTGTTTSASTGDSLAFLSIDGLYQAVGGEKRNNLAPQFTDHYFTGDYPTTLTDLNGRGSSDPKQISLLKEAG